MVTNILMQNKDDQEADHQERLRDEDEARLYTNIMVTPRVSTTPSKRKSVKKTPRKENGVMNTIPDAESKTKQQFSVQIGESTPSMLAPSPLLSSRQSSKLTKIIQTQLLKGLPKNKNKKKHSENQSRVY